MRFAQAEGYLQFAENRALVLVEEAIAAGADRPRDVRGQALRRAHGGGARRRTAARSTRARSATSAATRPSSRSSASGRAHVRRQHNRPARCIRERSKLRAARAGSPRTSSTGWSAALTGRLSVWARGCSRCVDEARGDGAGRRSTCSSHEGERYLVAPRGDTQWVRNLRAEWRGATAGGANAASRFTATELADEQKTLMLRAYLKRWKAEVASSSTASARTPPSRICAASPRSTRCSASASAHPEEISGACRAPPLGLAALAFSDS